MKTPEIPIDGWEYDPLLPYQDINDLKKSSSDIKKITNRKIFKRGLKGNYESISDGMEKKAIDGESVYCFIEGCGHYKIASLSKSDKFIYFEKICFPSAINRIFYSYQSDNEISTQFIENLLKEIISVFNDKYNNILNGKYIALEKATKSDEGAVKIDQIILNKIKRDILFIADLTPLEICKNYSNNESKTLYNSNVCIELGYALAEKKPEQIVLLCPLFMIPSMHPDIDELKKINLPFDIKTNKCVISTDISDFIKRSTDHIVSQLLRMQGHSIEKERGNIEDIAQICLNKFNQ